MTYSETLDWMFAQLPMYQQKGKVAYTAKLDSIKHLCSYLKNPHTTFKSIHVAGTNGKGSSSHMLASILQEAGYKVGLYTSPHLKDFRERIRINGTKVPKQFVVDFIKEHQSFFKTNRFSFFEMTVGMAFSYFSKKKVDIAIVEVGLGGRLDSTNILSPEVSLITNIGWDHTELLGDSLEKIAGEKAGIIKQGVPVVIGEYQRAVAPVFKEVAKKKNASIHFASRKRFKGYKTDLKGAYQTKNIKGVLATLELLKDFKVAQTHISQGFKKVIQNTGLLGRWQVLGKDPTILCDTAHNYQGLKLVLKQLNAMRFQKLHMVLGMVKDKEHERLLSLFPKQASYYFCELQIPRGLDAASLKRSAAVNGLLGKEYGSVSKALKEAIKQASKKDLIFVGGSTFTVAEVV